MAVKNLSKDAVTTLKRYRWPGNVRQLENTCRWLTVMAPGQRVGVDDLPDDIVNNGDIKSESTTETNSETLSSWLSLLSDELATIPNDNTDVLTQYQRRLEQIALEHALARFDGHKQKAALWLGWGRNTLTRKRKNLLK